MASRFAQRPAWLTLLVLGLHACLASARQVVAAPGSFYTPKRVSQVSLCIAPYNLTVTGLTVTGTTVPGYPCDADNKAITSEPPIGLFSFTAAPPTCNFMVIGGKPGQYEAFVQAMVEFGSSLVAYNFYRTIYVKPKNPGVTTCVDGDNKPNGNCYCDTEPEREVITGTSGKITAKMIDEIESLILFDPITYERLGSTIIIKYKGKGPNIGYL